jgi:hypothetical protein
MRCTTKVLFLFAALLPVPLVADPATEVRRAVEALGSTSYAWETTTRQRFKSETTEPRLNPNAPLETQGKFDPNSYLEITLLPSRETLPVPVTAFFRLGDAIGQTPLGWMRRTEMRNVPGPDRTVDFQGKPVRVTRALSVALRATALHPPVEDLLDLLDGIKSWRSSDGLIVGELRDALVEKLWADPQAKRAPEIQGTIIFKLSEQGVAEYHFLLGIGFPNSRSKKIAWSLVQWSTRIKGIGATTVEPPAEVVKRLTE